MGSDQYGLFLIMIEMGKKIGKTMPENIIYIIK